MFDEMEFMLGENSGILILQIIIIGLAIAIIVMLYSDNGMLDGIKDSVDSLECVKECPQCPDCPDLVSEGCPDCNCNENVEGDSDTVIPKTNCPACPKCPKCPACPTHKELNVEDIVDAIFPGRNVGFTTHGNYYPMDGLGENSVELAYSPVSNMTSNNNISNFSDAMKQSQKNLLPLSTKKDGPMNPGKGVMTGKVPGLPKSTSSSQSAKSMKVAPKSKSSKEPPMTPPDSPKSSSGSLLTNVENEVSVFENQFASLF